MTVKTYRGRQVGTVDDAAALCGVKRDTYYYYRSRLGAPQPIRWRDPDQRGVQMYDMEKVREWNEARPGTGARTDLQKAKPAERDSSGRFAAREHEEGSG